MVDTESNKVLCSWCDYDVFIPISDKLAKCYNCETLKTLDDMRIMPPTDVWEAPETTEE